MAALILQGRIDGDPVHIENRAGAAYARAVDVRANCASAIILDCHLTSYLGDSTLMVARLSAIKTKKPSRGELLPHEGLEYHVP